MPNLQQHPLRTSRFESPHPIRKQTFQKKKIRALTILEVQWSIQFPGSSISKPILTGHGSASCPAEDGQNQGPGGPSGSTWWSKQRIWTTTLRAKGSQHHGWWSLHSTKLLWMLRNIQSILVLDQHGKSWTPKTIECHFFWEIWIHWISTFCMGWLEGEIRGGAQQNTWLTCRMSCLLFTWCRDIWFPHCFFLQSTPYLSRCVIICSTFNRGRMHHELISIHIYIYACIHTFSIACLLIT